MTFALDPSLDIDSLAATFAAQGRVQVRTLLSTEDAERLYKSLVQQKAWRTTMNVGSKVFEFSTEELAAMDEVQRKALDLQVTAGARTGFQFRYRSLRIPESKDARDQTADLHTQLAAWFSQGEGLAFLKAVTGCEDVEFVDGQVTAYGPGDFLTAHDDAAPGTSRRAAYVFNLTKDWRIDWGGLLLFHDEGQVVAWPPSFNTLNLFRVPHPHSVSSVALPAPRLRYSISGWMRAGQQPR